MWPPRGSVGCPSLLARALSDHAALPVDRWICDATDKMHMLVPPAIKEEAETAAKAFREAMDDD